MNSKTINIHEDLIEQCRRGERSAQFKIYQLYHKAMFNTALRICAESEDAEDVLQESFVSAFGHLDQYRGDSSFGAWLKRIVINKSLNLVNKNKNMTRLGEEEIEEEPYYDWQDVPDHSMTVQSIKEAIKMLPTGFRSVMTLYLFEGYDHKEIAQILGITESTSKSQFNRAKRKVREYLNAEVHYG